MIAHRTLAVLGVVLAACASTQATASPAPTALTTARPASAAESLPVTPLTTARSNFRENNGAFTIEYPSTWGGGGAPDHLRIVDTTSGFPKTTFEVFPSGKETYRQIPPTAATFGVETGFGMLTARRFPAPGVLGRAPYFADVLSATFQAGGTEWVIEVVVQEMRRDEVISIVLGFLRTLRPG